MSNSRSYEKIWISTNFKLTMRHFFPLLILHGCLQDVICMLWTLYGHWNDLWFDYRSVIAASDSIPYVYCIEWVFLWYWRSFVRCIHFTVDFEDKIRFLRQQLYLLESCDLVSENTSFFIHVYIHTRFLVSSLNKSKYWLSLM